MIISNSKSEAFVLSRRIGCLIWAGEMMLPQVKEFKTLVSEGRTEQEVDRPIGPTSAIMLTLQRCIVVKKELSRKAKPKINWSALAVIFIPNLTYGHELWGVTEITTLWEQVGEISFLCRVAGLSIRDRLRSSVMWDTLERLCLLAGLGPP